MGGDSGRQMREAVSVHARAVSVHARAGLSLQRTLGLCDPTGLAKHTNACFVSGLALFHIKRLTSSKGIHDVVDVTRSHSKESEEGNSSCG